MELKRGRLSLRFVPLMLWVGGLTFVVHELAHWLAATALGYPVLFTVNQVLFTTPVQPTHALLVAAAGPLWTCLQGVLGYRWVKRRASPSGFAVVYMAFFMRAMALLISVIKPNDEARISRDLGLGMWTLPLIVVGALFWLVWRASQHLHLSLRDQLLCYAVASVVVTVFVFAG